MYLVALLSIYFDTKSTVVVLNKVAQMSVSNKIEFPISINEKKPQAEET